MLTELVKKYLIFMNFWCHLKPQKRKLLSTLICHVSRVICDTMIMKMPVTAGGFLMGTTSKSVARVSVQIKGRLVISNLINLQRIIMMLMLILLRQTTSSILLIQPFSEDSCWEASNGSCRRRLVQRH